MEISYICNRFCNPTKNKNIIAGTFWSRVWSLLWSSTRYDQRHALSLFSLYQQLPNTRHWPLFLCVFLCFSFLLFSHISFNLYCGTFVFVLCTISLHVVNLCNSRAANPTSSRWQRRKKLSANSPHSDCRNYKTCQPSQAFPKRKTFIPEKYY